MVFAHDETPADDHEAGVEDVDDTCNAAAEHFADFSDALNCEDITVLDRLQDLREVEIAVLFVNLRQGRTSAGFQLLYDDAPLFF